MMVSEGGKYSECASIFSPEKMATSPGQKVALKLMEFYRPGGASVKANQPTTTKEKPFEIAKDLVNASPDGGYLRITKVHVPTTLPTTTGTSVTNKKIKMGNEGLAVKLPNGRWNVLFNNGDQLINVDGDVHYAEKAGRLCYFLM
jgi:hypothetical protein